MLQAFKKLFGGDSNERELRKLWPLVEEINAHAERFQHLTDDELRAKTAEFKAKIREAVAPIEAEQAEVRARLKAAQSATADEVGDEVGGDGQAAPGAAERLSVRERQDLYQQLEDLEGDWLDAAEDALEEILTEAFAVVKETCRRMVGKTWEAGGSEITWDMVPYDVQLIGGIVLHRGSVAEMKTGEGKTLVAVAPIYLNALVGRGVHVVTVNPYLAQRDAEWMGPIYEFHGLTVDCIDKHPSHSPGRRQAYRADITYGTNNEFGFDYLRDNSFVVDPEQLVQRGHHYAIVDEVDSVLIDEARTPLIISGPVPQGDEDRFQELNPPVEKLVYSQQKLVAGYVADAERLLKERDAAEAAGDRKRASQLEEEAGLALLRAQRGFPRNKKLIKLKGEPGVEQLLRKTEFFYLQDNARRMPEVDEPLYFALDEKLHQIEMTDKGREFIARAAGEDVSFFVIPDMGEEVARIEREHEAKKKALYERLQADTSLSEEKRENKLMNDLALLNNEMEEAKRNLYTLYSERNERIHAVNQLLRAYTLYEKDVEYIVQDDKVMIVDEHTGRVLPGRRYSDGLHQAIEAKEKVKVQAATQTYATITIQNYFRLYAKLAGMTGTAETEAEEFYKIYSLPVVVIPTNRPVVRNDMEDLVYKTKRAKYKAVLDRIEAYHKKGQPVLVGTTSVEVSETVSRMLQRAGIKHNVLNAKASRAQAEAQIVAEAGRRGAVTIATNMAGRGTDIKLGPGVKELGGLAILGTERHESRRIDLQLRGRSGRQGDPGESVFYVSLEDDLMRLFGHDRTARIMDRMGMQEDEVITHKWITKGIERAQQKVEQNNFAIRKRQLEYDDVLNAQREVIYDRRMHALVGDRLRGDILDMLRAFVERVVREHFGEGEIDEIREKLLRHLAFDLQIDRETAHLLGEDGLIERILDEATEHYRRKRAALARPFHNSARQMMAQATDENRPKKLFVDFTDGRRLLRATVRPEDVLESEGEEINDALERAAVLSVIDAKWVDHLRDLDEVKEGVGLRAYGQKDPLIEYKMEAFRLFKDMIEEIDNEVVSLVFKAGPVVQRDAPGRPAQVQAPRPRLDQRRAQTQHASGQDYAVKIGGNGNQGSSAERDPTAKAEPVVVGERVGRNDPCPCGSGKKYKHCHGRA
ncbi:MAG TPA: preprotein translocase subunit SecA [Rubricoccaceae bacterium]|nr:preprotein translocase subunit SecA [Rubricoccaceae bacterium]